MKASQLSICVSGLIRLDDPIWSYNHVHFPVMFAHWYFTVYYLLLEGQRN